MPYQAIVYLRHVSQKSATNLGEISVEPLPAGSPLKQGSHIKFVHGGRTELWRVDMIAPDDWDHTGVTPTIHVVQSEDDRKAPPVRAGA
jgi:hypothetical protein